MNKEAFRHGYGIFGGGSEQVEDRDKVPACLNMTPSNGDKSIRKFPGK